ncbi:MAG: hemolysin family protein [Treponema sp.]|jgi:putative hemolysin|nr:hemolysin family protein [Treponema sp.]
MDELTPLASLWPWILAIFVIVVLGSFFALIEMAFGSIRKGRLRSLAEGGDQSCLRALEAAGDAGFYLQVCRIWIAVLWILAGVLGGFLVRPLGDDILASVGTEFLGDLAAAAAVILILSLAVVVLGIFIPRIIAAAAPEKVIARFLPAVRLFSLPCRPLLGFYGLINTAARRLFHLDKAETTGMTEDELRGALAEGEKSGVVESKERTMVEGVFYLGDRPAGAFMTHRSEIEWLDIHASPQEIRELIQKGQNQGCFPVAEDTLDNILGALYREDLLRALVEDPSWEFRQDLDQGLKILIRRVSFIPETMSALKAFEAFRRGNTDYLFVMDEYGGFSGILSVRDLVEEIVGEFSAAAGEDEEIRPQEGGGWIAGGSVNIDDAIKVLGLDSLAEEDHPDFHTLAGFILSIAEEIPRPGARFVYGNFEFKILNMDGNRIDRVLISPLKEPALLPS